MRYLLLSSSLTTCALLMGMGGVAVANPEGGVVVAGAATISESVARLDVTQTTDRAVIDWRSFNIEVGETTAFHQPNSGSVTVNRVKTNDPSRIAGNLTANGNIVLINPAGVFFSKDAVVDVGGLIATSSDIDTGRAMAGDFRFDRAGFSDAQITNEGTITARESGLVGLVAPQVENHGVITAKLGKVHLASGDQMTVDLYGDGVINIGASDELTHQLVHNTGKIEATGGEIRMTAAAGAQVVNSLISVEGELKAPAVTQTGGKIIIGEGNHSHISIAGSVDVRGRSGGQVQISGHNIIQQGTISAEGREGTGGEVRVRFSGAYLDNESSHIRASGQSGKGGTIAVTGETGSQAFISGTYDVSSMMDMGGRVQVTTDEGHLKLFGSRVMARGATGGGSIAIGGEYRGGGTLAHALTTGINYATYLDASALDGGDGGDIVVWSDENTSFAGHADARGGSLSGNGGLIEVSSKQLLRMDKNSQITAAARSLSGLAGTLLLDPKDIIIATGGLDGGISAFELVDPNVDTGIFGGGWIRTLSTGNVLVTDSLDDLMATNSGAVYLFNAATGALISTLFGTTANDQVGNDFITLLSNGNYVVRSLGWDNGAFADAGAATWGNGLTGVVGAVSAANSLVGTRANDRIGSQSITALSNGNYLVGSPDWDNGAIANAGAVTWGNGLGGTVGAVSAANSLVGTSANDAVGNGSITELSNGNYVVKSLFWRNGAFANAGAATWGNGLGGTVGAVSAANSLVGTRASDNVSLVVTALSNGNYVVGSPNWDNGAIGNAGAVTWGNGLGGTVGAVSAANSLVGTSASDAVGSQIIALSNGNYVTKSQMWDNGAIGNAGAVTWGNGLGGTVGAVSAANSLVGTTGNDQVGYTMTVLSNGNYVVGSSLWDNGAFANAGAATWGNGLGGTVGAVSAANSLVGTRGNDEVGSQITVLSNGNYVVGSSSWDNGAIINAGAATWGNGLGGTVGAVSAANSLVGTTANDQLAAFGVTALSNGNYVVGSSSWDNGAFADAGAVTWGNGLGGTVGVVSAANSLVGTRVGDNVGNNIAALSNGNYVVLNPFWDNGAVANVGAATWGNGLGGTVGAVSAANSLVGTTANDQVSSYGVTALSNGNYVVNSHIWDNGAIANAGAVTWGNGLGGTVGAVSVANSLVGTRASDRVGSYGVNALSNGNYVVGSPNWDNGAIVNAGAVTLGKGIGGTVGAITSANSILGTVASGSLSYSTEGNTSRFVVGNSVSQKAYSVLDEYPVFGSYDGYNDFSTSSVTMDPSFITNILNAGTAVTLQASNDIILNAALTANNGSGNGGALTFQAGRSILLNANITTDNGNLNLYANERLATGVVDAERSAGNAVITMGVGTSIDAGSGNVNIRLDNGAGKTNTAAGNISLRDIAANTITVNNHNSSGDVVLSSGTLSAAGTGNAITISSLRNFINTAGAAALSAASGRWLVYSTNPAADTLGGLTAGFRRFSCSYSSPGVCGFNATLGTTITLPATGNGFAYSITPMLTATPIALSALTYGDAIPSLTGYAYGLSGYLGSDSSADILTGSLTGSTSYIPTSNVGSYNINYASGALASELGYGFTYANNATGISVGKKALVATANGQKITYGTSVPSSSVSYTGFVNSETSAVIDALATLSSVNSGILNAGTYTGNYTASGALDNNYSFSYISGDLEVLSFVLPSTVEYTSQHQMSLDRLFLDRMTRKDIIFRIGIDEMGAGDYSTNNSIAFTEEKTKLDFIKNHPIIITISAKLARILSLKKEDIL